LKYIISESQLDDFVNALDSFINSQSYDGVCHVMVDYDEQFDKFVLNIFFNKKQILGYPVLDQTKFMNLKIIEIEDNFRLFTGLRPFIYKHFDTCS
jgi:hypothetical protein